MRFLDYSIQSIGVSTRGKRLQVIGGDDRWSTVIPQYRSGTIDAGIGRENYERHQDRH